LQFPVRVRRPAPPAGRLRRSLAALCVAAGALAACAGGGAPSFFPDVVRSSDLSGGAASTGRVVFTIVVPARPQGAAQPAYVSPATQGVGITAKPATGAKHSSFFALGSSKSYCKGGTPSVALTCSLAVQVPAGSVAFTIDAYAGATAKTPVLASETLTQKVSPGKTSSVRLSMSGAVAFLLAALDDPFPALGTSAKIPVRVVAADADGYLIVGQYASPLAVSDSDKSGATKLSATTLRSSTDASKLTLAYNGKSVAAATIAVTGGKKLAAKVGFAPGAHGIVASPSTLFAAYGATETLLSLAGPGAVAPFTISTGSDGTNDTPCGAYLSVAASTSTDFALSATGKLGACWLAVSDSAGHHAGVPVLVSGFGWPGPLPTPTPVVVPTAAPFTSSTSQPLPAITPAPPGQTPQPIPLAVGSAGGFSATLTIDVDDASAIAPGTTLASTLTNQAVAPGPLAVRRQPKAIHPDILLAVAHTFSNDLTAAKQPSHSYVLPANEIVAGSNYWLAFYDPTQPQLGWQLGYEGPATVSRTTLSFTGSPGSFTFHGGQTYYYAVYALSIAAATPSPAPTPSPTPHPTPTPTGHPTPTPTASPTPTPGALTVTVQCAQSGDACSNGTTSSHGSVQFTAANDTATFTPHESAAGVTFKLHSDTCNTTDDPSATGNWATLSPGPGSEAQFFVATAVNASSGGNPANCTAVIKDSYGQSVTVDIQVTIGNIGINIK
jgi:hypothetical protein